MIAGGSFNVLVTDENVITAPAGGMDAEGPQKGLPAMTRKPRRALGDLSSSQVNSRPADKPGGLSQKPSTLSRKSVDSFQVFEAKGPSSDALKASAEGSIEFEEGDLLYSGGSSRIRDKADIVADMSKRVRLNVRIDVAGRAHPQQRSQLPAFPSCTSEILDSVFNTDDTLAEKPELKPVDIPLDPFEEW